MAFVVEICKGFEIGADEKRKGQIREVLEKGWPVEVLEGNVKQTQEEILVNLGDVEESDDHGNFQGFFFCLLFEDSVVIFG